MILQILLQAQTNSILPSTLLQFFSVVVPVIVATFGAVKAIKAYAKEAQETERVKSQHRLDLEVAKINKDIELAKANQFMAQSVNEIWVQITAAHKELNDMKHSSALTKDHFSTLIEHLESLLDDLSKNFNQFLMNKAMK